MLNVFTQSSLTTSVRPSCTIYRRVSADIFRGAEHKHQQQYFGERKKAEVEEDGGREGRRMGYGAAVRRFIAADNI